MKSLKTIVGLFFLITIIAINNVSAQWTNPTPLPRPYPTPRCTSTVSQIYFVASGQSVKEVHPGINDGNGYQLNILGTNVDKFEVIQEKYMTSLSIIPNYTNSTSAKWSVFFASKMGREISTIRMRSKCGTGEIKTYQLTEGVTLLDQ
ncbi:MAG TPA: hypothetical protein PKE69_24925 [Pyrinomonadaceae bacterium]|nr:hypothetical protein [Pyrinomonadaceae bacterium]